MRKLKLLVASYGTEGDTRPLLALCQGLIQTGHDATFFGEGSGAALAAATGVPFEALKGDIRASIEELLSSGALLRPAQMSRSIAAMATRHTEAWMRSLDEHGRGCDAILFTGLASYVAFSVAEHLGIQAVGVGLQPVVPTRDFPSPFLPPLPLPAFCNRFSHRLVMGALWKAFRGSVNSARRTVTGQPARRKMWKDSPALFGISPELVPQPQDWPATARITGYWPLPSEPWTPPESLTRFLGAGEPPVYVGFGSMVGFDRARMLEMLLPALEGRRALLSAGWSCLTGPDLPANILAVGPLPHDRLFPLVSVVVHHGGAGTSHTAARAGIPSVPLPFGGDQIFWANRLAWAGVAPRWNWRRPDAAGLRRALREAETNAMRERAREVGERMRQERGVETAVAQLESLIG